MSVKERLRQARFRSPSQEAMMSLLVAALHLKCRLEAVCGRAGVTHDQYNVLRILRGVYPGGHPRYEIALRLVDRAPDVTRLLDRLARQGLIKRYRAEGDRRLSLARITDRGLALLDRLDGPIDALTSTVAAPLRPPELAQLTDLCSRLIPAGDAAS
ncbi:MAG: MarR family transcriptional regulator [Gemmatimonadota bacterium]|nr:MarR family transcriptional regulator [Gemmatimonadota bacterium]